MSLTHRSLVFARSGINDTENCEIKCPSCQIWTPCDKWKDSVIGCDVCDEHDSIQCPNCEEDVDGILRKIKEIKVLNNGCDS